MGSIPKIIDLFAGVGGLSLGAARAGFDIAAAVEIDHLALATHAKNFPNTLHSDMDVGKLSGRQLLDLSGLAPGELDGLVGGPPCQGFSVMGTRKPEDVRNDLFVHFFRLVHETKPKFFIAENVPGIMHERYNDVRNAALEWVQREYSVLKPIKIKANLYGAPTSRTRIFFIGYNPKIYSKPLDELDFQPSPDRGQVIVRQALQGLPTYIDPSWQNEKSSWRKVDHSTGDFFANSLTDRIPLNVGCVESISRLQLGEVSGFLGTVHSDKLIDRYSILLPGQQDYISKAVRLNADGFCPTIRAGTNREKGSYQAVRPIHHSEARVICPREAARLQGFPDWFAFHPTKWHSFRQIGNSVSPLVAEQILHALIRNI